MQKARENWAVIELNDVSIAGEFTVLASLSDGYKVIINRETKQVVQRGYDWSNSIFDAPETQNLHGIIHFDLGYYEGRRYILNGRIRAGDSDEKPVVPYGAGAGTSLAGADPCSVGSALSRSR
jgi:hypothetical protein